jgi:hypothetical protein
VQRVGKEIGGNVAGIGTILSTGRITKIRSPMAASDLWEASIATASSAVEDSVA